MNHPIDIRQYFIPIQPNNQGISEKLIYKELNPDNKLQKYIYCYWIFKTIKPLKKELNHNVVADGCIDIFFELSNPLDNFVMGFSEKFTPLSLGTSFYYVGIRFFPTMFSQIFKINSKEITNKLENLANVVPSISHLISKNIQSKSNITEIKDIFDIYFLQKINESNFDWDGRFYESLKIILENNGKVEIEKDLKTGISQRQLLRFFEYYTGGSPKKFSQVIRFQNILRAKPSNQSLTQNKMFYDFGYYDQSHFIKEFKKHHGLTPNMAFKK